MQLSYLCAMTLKSRYPIVSALLQLLVARSSYYRRSPSPLRSCYGRCFLQADGTAAGISSPRGYGYRADDLGGADLLRNADKLYTVAGMWPAMYARATRTMRQKSHCFASETGIHYSLIYINSVNITICVRVSVILLVNESK